LKNPDFMIAASPYDERDLLFDQAVATRPPLPESFSLREDMFGIRNQGPQGSCVAQSLAAMQERNNLKHLLDKGYLSPQFIYDCRPKNRSGRGMNVRNALKFLRVHGAPLEKSYPYRQGKDTPPIGLKKMASELKKEAEFYRIQGFAKCTTVQDTKRAIYLNGPCVIVVPVYAKPWTGSSTVEHQKYIIPSRMWIKEQGYKKMGGHAMAVVGWDLHGFQIRNSWGYNWGSRGHCTFPYGDWGRQYEVWSAIDHEPDVCAKPDTVIQKIKKCMDKSRWG
tara:strand:+ start:3489 stop:4322 length:834 start_codon:yes stop_codon:yes gene_type:complete